MKPITGHKRKVICSQLDELFACYHIDRSVYTLVSLEDYEELVNEAKAVFEHSGYEIVMEFTYYFTSYTLVNIHISMR